jgi:NAD(P)-dependent dehydrogenase (short-subunit alcohol dehydrogenase family)
VNDLGGAVDGAGASPVADEVVEEIRESGSEAVANYESVASVEGGRAIFQAAIDGFGGLDILVNNAGVLRDRTIFKLEEEDWDTVIAVHLKGHYCCTRPFAQYIRETKRLGCRIINFSSVSGLWGNFGQSNYGAAKAGIAGFGRVLALELAKYECTVNTISPGAATRMTIPLAQGGGSIGDAEDPLQSPELVAPIVAWLASPAAQSISGEIIHAVPGLLGIMQQPKLVKTYTADHLWTLEELDELIPALVAAREENDERLAAGAKPERVGG